MDPKWSPQLPLIDLSPFPGSWTHLGASRGLRSQKRGPYLAIFGPSLTPPANPVKFFWSKMACTGVPHIVLHVSCWTRTSGGYFRPSEVRFRAKIPLSSHRFYNVKTQKTQFLQNSSWDKAEIEKIHCPICTQPISSSWQNGLPPALATSMQRGVPDSFKIPRNQCQIVLIFSAFYSPLCQRSDSTLKMLLFTQDLWTL